MVYHSLRCNTANTQMHHNPWPGSIPGKCTRKQLQPGRGHFGSRKLHHDLAQRKPLWSWVVLEWDSNSPGLSLDFAKALFCETGWGDRPGLFVHALCPPQTPRGSRQGCHQLASLFSHLRGLLPRSDLWMFPCISIYLLQTSHRGLGQASTVTTQSTCCQASFSLSGYKSRSDICICHVFQLSGFLSFIFLIPEWLQWRNTISSKCLSAH